MKLPEYKAQELFEKYEIPTMRGGVVDSSAGAIQAAATLNYPVVIKAQIPIGGRGKAGGILFVHNEQEAVEACERLLGSELRGYPVKKLLVVEQSFHQSEWYLSILLDRVSKSPVVMFTGMGGVEIEQTAREHPEQIKRVIIDTFVGVLDCTARYLLSSCGLPENLAASLDRLLKNLYRCFIECDALLAEINPLVVSPAGELIALDGKMEIDDSALYRLTDIAQMREELDEGALVQAARASGFLYIPVEKGGTVAVCSNGSGMLMSCIDMIAREGLTVAAALDLGGGATKERIAEAMRILFETPGVKAVLINIFGGITRCDEVAGGVKLALEKRQLDGKLIILRMEGTNKDGALDIVRTLPDVVSTDGLVESIRALTERRERL